MATGFSILKQGTVVVTSTLMILVNAGSVMAGDPFRQTESRPISDDLETAFEAMFREGNYQKAATMLEKMEKERAPLAYALKGAIAYTSQDWGSLKEHAEQTLHAAKQLGEQDPLRRDLYLAIGHFLEGSYLYEQNGAFSVFGKLQKVLHYFDEAKKHNPQDPELNLIKGYMDLLLAANLPLADTEDAMNQFKNYAAPDYLVYRGLAISYRDLDQYEKALSSLEKALDATPNNPEIHYLKGQILYLLGKQQQDLDLAKEAVTHFETAIANSDQLPESIRDSYDRELRLAKELVEEMETAQR